MTAENNLASSVGLRHVIEDGLAILANRALPKPRQDFVLTDLSDLLNKALRGSALARSSALFIGAGDRAAFDTYSLLGQLGTNATAPDTETLKLSAKAFDALKEGRGPRPEEKRCATEFLKQVLGSIERQAGIAEKQQIDIGLDRRVG